jgi:hypothetical protein
MREPSGSGSGGHSSGPGQPLRSREVRGESSVGVLLKAAGWRRKDLETLTFGKRSVVHQLFGFKDFERLGKYMGVRCY